MENISSYSIGISLNALKNGFREGKVAGQLHEPLQSLLPRITSRAVDTPTTIYLFSNEENAETRDFFGFALAGAVLQHVPSALLVDCAFLNIGLSGIVPQKDALGFLDLLLYGSSLGVITQETTGGVHVVGAGSFPVTKKMPFVLNAFEEAARRLVAHSRCAIFCGPLYDDEGELHPLIGAVDLPMLVRTTPVSGAGVVDPIEEQIATRWGIELVSVRITPVEEEAEPAAAAAPAPPQPAPAEPGAPPAPPRPATVPPERPAPPAPERPTPGPRETIPREPVEPVAPEQVTPAAPRPPKPPARPATTPPERPRPEPEFEEMAPPEPAPEPPKYPPTRKLPKVPRETLAKTKAPADADVPPERTAKELPPFGEKRYSSLLPKIATAAIALVVVVFLVWWFNKERIGGGDEIVSQEEPVTESVPPAEPGTGDETAAVTAVDTVASGQPEIGTDQSTPAAQPEEEGGGPATEPAAQQQERASPPGSRIDSRDILIMDDLQSGWAGYYLVHISSFRESSKARNEVANLEGQGFPVFIVFLDLEAKGKWYRVYAGPLDTREEARNMKKLLDDTPGVRFTRITRVAR